MKEQVQAFTAVVANPSGIDIHHRSNSSTREPWAERKREQDCLIFAVKDSKNSVESECVRLDDIPKPHGQRRVQPEPPEHPAPELDHSPRCTTLSLSTASDGTNTTGVVLNSDKMKSERNDRSTRGSSARLSKLPKAKEEIKVATPDRSKSVACARWVVVNKYFIVLTTILTIYALIGDDIRLVATNKPADVWFNVMTLICLAVFSFEIVMSCLGKDDYILGFFMALDVVSTVTLILDLTYVADVLMGDGEDLDKMRSGRTARVGAKAGRVVRVIRLVRILKLYKALYEAMHQRAKKAELDEWADIEADIPKEKMTIQESRVGKKLSEMTTRRVIILVLTMLLVLPFLRTQSGDSFPPSAFYGADEVYSAYMEMVSRPTWQEGKSRYDNAVLKYLYYHNWFTGNSGGCPTSSDSNYGCPSSYFGHLFWVGLASTEETQLDYKVNTTRLSHANVQTWNDAAKVQDDIYNYGTMPEEVLSIIAGEWFDPCNDRDKGIFRRGFSLLKREIEGKVSYAAPCPADLRNGERTKFFPRLLTAQKYDQFHFAFYFDMRPFSRQEALFGLSITGFICVVLCIASLYFSNDANKLVLRPVEHMIKRVESIRDNPLIAMRMADDEYKWEELRKARAQLTQKQSFRTRLWRSFSMSEGMCRCWKGGHGHAQEPMETVVLEKTIIKLGSLLALGFGEAGANIISNNLRRSDSAGVNVMIPGTKVECIVGKARIRDFSTATEVLQAKVMTFVNQIAEIVHGVVDEFAGAANKNNGDTFLLIWRMSGLNEATCSKFADMSMMAFAKILSAVHRAPILAAYRTHPGLQQRLGAHCRVRLSFGLHAGWAIEGAVGSEFKIDASYLSPNVSIASNVEMATMVYNVCVVVSQAVVHLCNDKMAAKCRLIDRVIIKGSTIPLMLYALDIDCEDLPVEEQYKGIMWNPRQRFKARQFLEAEKTRKMASEADMACEFDKSKDIALMRRRYNTEFLQKFHMGYQNYSHGEWQVAKRFLSETRTMLHGQYDDGPSQALLHFMETHGFIAPDGWHGVRELEDFEGPHIA